MMNSIYNKQNKLKFLCLLKAQRREYNFAKIYVNIHFFTSVLVIIIFSILKIKFQTELINTLSSFVVILIFIFNNYSIKQRNKHINFAAKIQQTFDVQLYNLRDDLYVLDTSKQKEIIAEYKNDNLEAFKNWYSDYSNLDFSKQILYCQKENIRWDEQLKSYYFRVVKTLAILFPIIMITFAIFQSYSIADFIVFFSLLFPLEQFWLNQCIGIHNNKKLFNVINNFYIKTESNFNNLTPQEKNCSLCKLQAYILENRKQSVSIPNFFYKLTKLKFQKKEDIIAEHISSENE